jgi:integrase
MPAGGARGAPARGTAATFNLARRRSRARTVQERQLERRALGSLRDRQLSQKTLKRYRLHVKQFFRWMAAEGYDVPGDTVAFDNMLAHYAEVLWQEGESRGHLSAVLCGLAHDVPSLRGSLSAAWRQYHAWLRLEPAARAPPLTPLLIQAFAGGFLRKGHVAAAASLMLGYHCLLRTCEFMSIRGMDLSVFAGTGQGQLRLLHTKIGQRLGITEQVAVTDPWIMSWAQLLLDAVPPTGTLLGMAPWRFRQVWHQVRAELGLPDHFAPYGMRRGGATHYFQQCTSFSLVSDRGRWSTERATRIYVTSALQDQATLLLTSPLLQAAAALLRRLPEQLRRMSPQAAERGGGGCVTRTQSLPLGF